MTWERPASILEVMFGVGTIELAVIGVIFLALIVFLGWILVRATRR